MHTSEIMLGSKKKMKNKVRVMGGRDNKIAQINATFSHQNFLFKKFPFEGEGVRYGYLRLTRGSEACFWKFYNVDQ